MTLFFLLLGILWNVAVVQCYWGAQPQNFDAQPPGLFIPQQNSHHPQQFPGNAGQHVWGQQPHILPALVQPQQLPTHHGWNPMSNGPLSRPNFPLQQHFGPLGHLPVQPFGPPQWPPHGNSLPTGRGMNHGNPFGNDPSEESDDSSEELPGGLGGNQVPPHLVRDILNGQNLDSLDSSSSEEPEPLIHGRRQAPASPLELDDDDDDSEPPLPDRMPGRRGNHKRLPSPAELAAELAELLGNHKNDEEDEDPNMLEPEDLVDEEDEDDDEDDDEEGPLLGGLPGELSPMHEPVSALQPLIPLNDELDDDDDDEDDGLPSPSEEVHIVDDGVNPPEVEISSGSVVSAGLLQDADLAVNCRNKRHDCAERTKLCNDTTFGYLMAQECAEECGICQVQQAGREETGKEQECKDTPHICFISKPFCNTFLFSMFTTNACPKTCGRCQANDDDALPPTGEAVALPIEDGPGGPNPLLPGEGPDGPSEGPDGPLDDLEGLDGPEDALDDEDNEHDENGPNGGGPGMPPPDIPSMDQNDEDNDLPPPDNLSDDEAPLPGMPLNHEQGPDQDDDDLPPPDNLSDDEAPIPVHSHNPRGPPLEAQLPVQGPQGVQQVDEELQSNPQGEAEGQLQEQQNEPEGPQDGDEDAPPSDGNHHHHHQ